MEGDHGEVRLRQALADPELLEQVVASDPEIVIRDLIDIYEHNLNGFGRYCGVVHEVLERTLWPDVQDLREVNLSRIAYLRTRYWAGIDR